MSADPRQSAFQTAINPPRRLHRYHLLFVLFVASIAPGCTSNSPATRPADTVQVEPIDYHGWKHAWAVRNKSCELIVVADVSRVMSFRLIGGDNLLWENPKLAGKTFPVDPRAWQNIGGEKLWPTQQNLFGKFTGIGYDWPPPWPWDAGASVAEKIPGGVRLTLPHDARFGAHAVREFILDAERPLVHVRQWIEKTAGEPAPMTLWTIAQVNDPKQAWLPSPFGDYANLGAKSEEIRLEPRRVSLGREEKKGLKIGITPREWTGYVVAEFAADAEKRTPMLVQSHLITARAEYPDKGLQAELYTSPTNFAKYTELELLSPLVTLKAGEKLRDDVMWQIVLVPERTDPVMEAAEAHRVAMDLLQKAAKRE
jgi:hypothetical protein